MLPKYTEPSAPEVMLSGNTFSPSTVMVCGRAACARVATVAANRPAVSAPTFMLDLLISESLYLISMFVGDAVDEVGAIVGQQQRAIVVDQQGDRATPGVAVVNNESDQEVVVLAGGHTVLHAHPHHL